MRSSGSRAIEEWKSARTSRCTPPTPSWTRPLSSLKSSLAKSRMSRPTSLAFARGRAVEPNLFGPGKYEDDAEYYEDPTGNIDWSKRQRRAIQIQGSKIEEQSG